MVICEEYENCEENEECWHGVEHTETKNCTNIYVNEACPRFPKAICCSKFEIAIRKSLKKRRKE